MATRATRAAWNESTANRAARRLIVDAAKPQEVTLACRRGWAQAYPQSAHLLNEEVVAWQKTRWSLNLTDI